MNEFKLAWAAFKNMMRAAARDPVWALVALCVAPFRAFKPFIGLLIILVLVLFVVGMGGGLVIGALGLGQNIIVSIIYFLILGFILLVLTFRFFANPLILHFGDMEGETPARHASPPTRKWLPSPAPIPAC